MTKTRKQLVPERTKGVSEEGWVMLATGKTKLVTYAIYALTFLFVGVVGYQQLSRSGWCNDESAHIPAGLYHLETGRMDAYRVNPPLPRMLAALPLLLDRPVIDWHYSDSPYIRNEYQFAHSWVSDNAEALRRHLFHSRMTVIVFFVIGLWSIARWAGRMYGTAAAWLAGAMWSLNPDVVTYSTVVAPDLPAAAMGLLAGYCCWDWLEKKERPFPWYVAIVVALAILCKFSWLFLLLLLPIVTLAYDLSKWRASVETRPNAQATRCNTNCPPKFGHVFRDAVRLTFSFSITLLIINWSYGFEGTGTRLGGFEFISQSLAGPDMKPGGTGNRFEEGPLAWVPVPLPREMLRGLDYLKWEFERGMSCYLRGTWKHRGWWYFYLYAMAVKIPLGYLALIFGGLLSLFWQSCCRTTRYSWEWLSVLIAVLFITLVSSQIGFTHHVRYVLPAYGFLFLAASRMTAVLPTRTGIALVAMCLSGTVWFHATHLGLAHTFFNPLAGGPNNGWRHLGRSNVDWGQSTYRMVDWIKEHPEQRPMTVLFRSSLGNPALLVADQQDVSTSVSWQQRGNEPATSPSRNGWFLVSSYQMTLKQNQYFHDKTPLAQPYPDVLLFHFGSTDDGDGDSVRDRAEKE